MRPYELARRRRRCCGARTPTSLRIAARDPIASADPRTTGRAVLLIAPTSIMLSMNVVRPNPASPTGTGSARRAANGTTDRTVTSSEPLCRALDAVADIWRFSKIAVPFLFPVNRAPDTRRSSDEPGVFVCEPTRSTSVGTDGRRVRSDTPDCRVARRRSRSRDRT